MQVGLPLASIVVGLLVTLLAMALRLDGRLAAMQRATAPPEASALSWSCDHHAGQAPLRIVCMGPSGPGITNWVWQFEEGSSVTGRAASHVYLDPGERRVALTLITPTGNWDAGYQEVVIQPMAPGPGPAYRQAPGGTQGPGLSGPQVGGGWSTPSPD